MLLLGMDGHAAIVRNYKLPEAYSIEMIKQYVVLNFV